MRKIRIISFGDNKYHFIKDGINHYLNKIKYYAEIDLIELDEIAINDINSQLNKEKQIIEKYIPKNYHVFILDIKGQSISSIEFSNLIDKNLNICFIIGSSHGIDNSLKEKYQSISFGKMTFPHKLFRIILLEQIYRGFNIINKTKYHK